MDALTSIGTLFNQLRDGSDFSAQGDEIVPVSTLVRWGYDNILQTGLFDSDCKK